MGRQRDGMENGWKMTRKEGGREGKLRDGKESGWKITKKEEGKEGKLREGMGNGWKKVHIMPFRSKFHNDNYN